MTPVSPAAFVYVTPEIVTELVPAVMVPERVPPRIPVPVFTLSVTFVSAETFAATPPLSRDWTTTLKADPLVTLEPPFTEVIANCVAGGGVTLNGSLSAAVKPLAVAWSL